MISFEEFKIMYDASRGEPEFEIYFHNVKESYMIIKYKDGVSFQRCGVTDGSGEYYYPSLLELYNTVSVDGICLRERWKDIDTIIANAWCDLSREEELIEFKEYLNLM